MLKFVKWHYYTRVYISGKRVNYIYIKYDSKENLDKYLNESINTFINLT